MSQFNVDSEMIATKSAQAKTQMANISADVNAMTVSLQDLQNSWTGSASQKFLEVLTRWRTTQQNVEEALGDINRALDQAGVNYSETERSNAAMFTG